MSTEHPVVAAAMDLLNGTATSTAKPNVVGRMTDAPAALAIDPLISHVGDGIFLQTKTAQGLAGIFVWIALFITCQQVGVKQTALLANYYALLLREEEVKQSRNYYEIGEFHSAFFFCTYT